VSWNLVNFVSLLIFTSSLAIGQVMFKQVGLAIRADGLLSLFCQPALYAALGIYGFSTILWIWILSRISLSQAYPWVAAGMAIVPLSGWYVFGERVDPLFWVGVGLILAGIMITQYAGQPS
jgi:multidrug transporter EmrE-like cation transporter